MSVRNKFIVTSNKNNVYTGITKEIDADRIAEIIKRIYGKLLETYNFPEEDFDAMTGLEYSEFGVISEILTPAKIHLIGIVFELFRLREDYPWLYATAESLIEQEEFFAYVNVIPEE